MSRYDGLIIPRSYSEYINKTDAATLSQALQLAGVLAQQVTAGNNAAVTSSAVNAALSEYINKTDAATIQQALQVPGVLSENVAAGDNKAVTSSAVNAALSEYINKTDAATLQQALQLPGVLSEAVAAGDNKAVKSSAVNNALENFNLYPYHSKRSASKFDELQATSKFYIQLIDGNSIGTFPQGAKSGVILTFAWDLSYATQVFIEIDKQRRIYIRYNEAGTPGAWKQLAFM